MGWLIEARLVGVKYNGSPTILFGIEVTHIVREDLELDRKNGNHRWAEAIHKELKGLQDHNTFSFLKVKLHQQGISLHL